MLGQSYRDALGPEGSKGQYSSIDIVIVFFDDSSKIWATRPGGAVFDSSGWKPREKYHTNLLRPGWGRLWIALPSRTPQRSIVTKDGPFVARWNQKISGLGAYTPS